MHHHFTQGNSQMNKMNITVTLLSLLMLLAGTIFSAGCNTWDGAGKDVERAGEKMQGD